jgi:hypothetical protein
MPNLSVFEQQKQYLDLSFYQRDTVAFQLNLLDAADLPYNLTGKTLVLTVEVPNGTTYTEAVDVLDTANGIIEVGLSSETAQYDGRLLCELTVFELGTRITAAQFNIRMLPSIQSDGAIVPENDNSLLAQLLMRLDGVEAGGGGTGGGGENVDLTNYYTKSQVDTKLTGKANSSHTHPEYALATNTYTKAEVDAKSVGGATVDLSNYYTITQVNTQLAGKANSTHTHNEYAAKTETYTKTEVDTMIAAVDGGESVDLTNYYTKPEIDTKLADVATGGSVDLSNYYTINQVNTQLAGKANSTHSHGISEVTGLQTALDNKAAATHSHPEYVVDLTNYYTKTQVDTSLAAKANTSHDHNISQVTGLQAALDSKAGTAHSHMISDVSNLQNTLDGKANNYHIHTFSEVSGLQSALDNKAGITHSHAIGDVSGLQTVLDGKANNAHSHAIGDVTGLQSALDGKSGTSHTHTVATSTNDGFISAANQAKLDGLSNYSHPASHPATMITGLATVATSGNYNDLTNKPTSMAPTAHTHSVDDVTGLAAALATNLSDAKGYTDTKVAELVGSSPETLNTLNELATSLGNDPNFATTVSTQIGLKADKTYVDNLVAGATSSSASGISVADAANQYAGTNVEAVLAEIGNLIGGSRTALGNAIDQLLAMQ